MFEGTLRDNLDPRHVHDDTELWSVLGMMGTQSLRLHEILTDVCVDHARLKEHVSQMEGQLDAQIQEGGKEGLVDLSLWKP